MLMLNAYINSRDFDIRMHLRYFLKPCWWLRLTTLTLSLSISLLIYNFGRLTRLWLDDALLNPTERCLRKFLPFAPTKHPSALFHIRIYHCISWLMVMECESGGKKPTLQSHSIHQFGPKPTHLMPCRDIELSINNKQGLKYQSRLREELTAFFLLISILWLLVTLATS